MDNMRDVRQLSSFDPTNGPMKDLSRPKAFLTARMDLIALRFTPRERVSPCKSPPPTAENKSAAAEDGKRLGGLFRTLGNVLLLVETVELVCWWGTLWPECLWDPHGGTALCALFPLCFFFCFAASALLSDVHTVNVLLQVSDYDQSRNITQRCVAMR